MVIKGKYYDGTAASIDISKAAYISERSSGGAYVNFGSDDTHSFAEPSYAEFEKAFYAANKD